MIRKVSQKITKKAKGWREGKTHLFYTGSREHDFTLQMQIFWRTLRNINTTGFSM